VSPLCSCSSVSASSGGRAALARVRDEGRAVRAAGGVSGGLDDGGLDLEIWTLEPIVDGMPELDPRVLAGDRLLAVRHDERGEKGRHEPKRQPRHVLASGSLVGDPHNHCDRPYRPDAPAALRFRVF
jgi:hypothetical protein